jgi:hypothetical protein
MDNVSYLNRGMKYLFYISVAVFLVFIIILIVHFTVTPLSFLSFINMKNETLPDDDLPEKGETFSTDRPISNDVKLNIVTSKYNAVNFTLSFDCYVSRNYKSTNVPRVLFYFGQASTPVSITANSQLRETVLENDASNNGLDIQPNILRRDNSDMVDKFEHSNFVIYLDPVRNDMKVGIVLLYDVPSATTGSTVQTIRVIEVLPTIKNIPIEQPFQVSFVLGSTFAEIYKDKLLMSTHKIGSILHKQNPNITNIRLNGVPISARPNISTAGPNLYSPISFIGNTVRVGNIQYFNSKLDGKYIRTMTNELSKSEFFKQL